MAKRNPTHSPFDSLDNLEEWPIAKDCLSAEFTQDLNAVKAFLYQYRGSQATFDVYRREMERIFTMVLADSFDSPISSKTRRH